MMPAEKWKAANTPLPQKYTASIMITSLTTFTRQMRMNPKAKNMILLKRDPFAKYARKIVNTENPIAAKIPELGTPTANSMLKPPEVTIAIVGALTVEVKEADIPNSLRISNAATALNLEKFCQNPNANCAAEGRAADMSKIGKSKARRVARLKNRRIVAPR